MISDFLQALNVAHIFDTTHQWPRNDMGVFTEIPFLARVRPAIDAQCIE